MANIKSQIKRNRQNEKRRTRNKAIRSEVNSRVKSTLKSAESGQSDEEALRISIKKLIRLQERISFIRIQPLGKKAD